MRVTYGGVRGSFPVGHPDMMRYGGDTTSVLVEGAAGDRILLDLGTGARRLGHRMTDAGRRETLVLLSHFHLDHLSGLPMFSPLYRKDWTVEFASPSHGGFEIEPVLTRLMEQPYWPLQMDELAGHRIFRKLDAASAEPMVFGGLEIRWCPTHHEGGATAYRIDEPATGAAMLFATDNEWPESSAEDREAFLALGRAPRPVDVLIIDAQFTTAEYARRRHWGHNPWPAALEIAGGIGARSTHLTHHDPERDDGALSVIEAEVMRVSPVARMARQEMTFCLRGRGVEMEGDGLAG